MKIAIVGIGGVGGYYGGLLAKRYSADEDVEIVFIARGDHLQQIKKNGLNLITEKGTFTVRPDLATDNPADCGIIVWEKYVLISVFATVTTFLDKTMHSVIDSEKGKALLDNLLTEVFRVSEAKGI